MIEPEAPEGMVTPDVSDDLGIAGQGLQPELSPGEDEDGPPGAFALHRHDPLRKESVGPLARTGLLRDQSFLDELGHLGRGRRMEEGAQRQLDPDPLAKPRHRRGDLQGIPTQLEEVVVRPDRIQTEDLGPSLLDQIDRRQAFAISASRGLWHHPRFPLIRARARGRWMHP